MPSIRELRERQFMTQTDLARKSGVAWRTIDRLEKSLNVPRFVTLRKIANGLGVDASEIELRPGPSNLEVKDDTTIRYVIDHEHQMKEPHTLKELDEKVNRFIDRFTRAFNELSDYVNDIADKYNRHNTLDASLFMSMVVPAFKKIREMLPPNPELNRLGVMRHRAASS